jgi:hypothetical protein
VGVIAPQRERTPPRRAPEPPAPRGPRRVPWGLVALAVIALALWQAPGFLRGLLPDLPNPFAAETVDRSGPAVLRSIQDLHELRAASGHFEVVVDLERDTALPSEILGERTLFVAVGDVDASVDLGGLDANDVSVSEDRHAATIVLPRPRLARPQLDIERSHVYSRERGVLNRIGGLFGDDTGAERAVLLVARQRIAAAARNGSGLVPRAERNTRDVLEGLLRSLGFTSVTVRFGPAT